MIANAMVQVIDSPNIPQFDRTFYEKVAKKLGWPTSRHKKSVELLRRYWNGNRGNLKNKVQDIIQSTYSDSNKKFEGVQSATNASQHTDDSHIISTFELGPRRKKPKRMSENWIVDGNGKKDQAHYCICKKKYDKTVQYMQCDGCKAWYHYSCMNIPQTIACGRGVSFYCGQNVCNNGHYELKGASTCSMSTHTDVNLNNTTENGSNQYDNTESEEQASAPNSNVILTDTHENCESTNNSIANDTNNTKENGSNQYDNTESEEQASAPNSNVILTDTHENCESTNNSIANDTNNTKENGSNQYDNTKSEEQASAPNSNVILTDTHENCEYIDNSITNDTNLNISDENVGTQINSPVHIDVTFDMSSDNDNQDRNRDYFDNYEDNLHIQTPPEENRTTNSRSTPNKAEGKPNSVHSATPSSVHSSDSETLPPVTPNDTHFTDGQIENSNNDNGRNDENIFTYQLPEQGSFIFPQNEWRELRLKQKGRQFPRNEWEHIIMEGIKTSNPFCVFVFKHHNVTVARNRNPNIMFRTEAGCKFEGCGVRVKVAIHTSFQTTASYSGNVKHDRTEMNSRNVAGKVRRDLRKQFSLGSLPMKIYVDKLGELDESVYNAGNRDASSCNLHVLQKISSESRTCTREDRDELESLMKLKYRFIKEYPGIVPGLIQKISAKPFYVICFTEGGIRTFHKRSGEQVLFWDATGSCVRSTLNNKRLLYYELCIGPKGGKGRTLPLAWMISEDHSEPAILDWMNVFRAAEKKIYGHSNLCVPKMICSDRAWVFLMGTVKIFNCDNLPKFMERAWRIVNRFGTIQDFQYLTIPHACASHFMKNVRNLCKTINCRGKFVTYAISLLLNAIYWEEFVFIFNSLVVVLLSKYKNNLFMTHAKQLHEAIDHLGTSNYDFRQGLGDTSPTENNNEAEEESVQFVSTEAEYLSAIPSSFKVFFKDQVERLRGLVADAESQDIHVLCSNPDSNEVLLDKVVKDYLPTCILWSNILVGDLSRYKFNDKKSYREYKTEISNIPKTTGHAEQRMGVMKNIQLGKKKINRVDEFISILAHDLKGIERSYVDHSTRITGRKRQGKDRVSSARANYKDKFPLPNVQEFDHTSVPQSASTLGSIPKHNPEKSVRKRSSVTIKEEWNKKSRRQMAGVFQRAPKRNPLQYVNKSKGSFDNVSGMGNIHNRCWFNAVVQSIIRIPNLQSFIENFDNIPINTNEYHRDLAYKEMFKLLKRMSRSDGSTIPNSVINNAFRAATNACKFQEGRQQDAHEFMVSFIIPFFHACNLKELCNAGMQVQRTCKTCKNISFSIENQTFVSVTIPDIKDHNEVVNIQDLANEQIKHNEDILSKCNKCSHETAHLTRELINSPELLIIQIQRTNGNITEGGLVIKVNTRVRVDENISLSVGNSVSSYNLTAVIRHHGDFANLGHYTAKVNCQNRYFVIDDEIIGLNDRNRNSEEVSDRAAYIAIYHKTFEMTANSCTNRRGNIDELISSVKRGEGNQNNKTDQFTSLKSQFKTDFLNAQEIGNANKLMKVLCSERCMDCSHVVSKYVEVIPMLDLPNTLEKYVEEQLQAYSFDKLQCTCSTNNKVRKCRLVSPAKLLIGIVEKNVSLTIEKSMLINSKEFGNLGTYKLLNVVIVGSNGVDTYQREGETYKLVKGGKKTSHEFNSTQIQSKTSDQDYFLIYIIKYAMDYTGKLSVKSGLIGALAGLDKGFNNTVLDNIPAIHGDELPESHTVNKFCLGRRDLSILTTNDWFNDVIITSYITLVNQNVPSSADQVLVMDACWAGSRITKSRNPHWYTAEANQLNRNRNWLLYNLVVLPISYSSHWILFVVEPKALILTIMDPLGKASKETLLAASRAIRLCEFLRALTDVDSIDMQTNISKWKIIIPHGLPQQMDGHNCGAFVCMYARSVIERRWLQIDSTEKFMSRIRNVMLHEILLKRLVSL